MPHTFVSSRNKKSFWKDWNYKKILKIGGISLGVIFLFTASVFAYFAKDLPSPGHVSTREVAESTKIYDRTGEHILYDIHGEEKRTIIPFTEMNDSIKYATIALEDQDFYSHSGIKLTSIIRAALKDVLHQGAAQGGSTITQQFVKNSILTREKTFTRKIKEVILSIEMEQKFSKDEILAMYLNEIPYGSNAYGVEAAAQTFFNKHAKELSLDEAALLASLPQAPSYYSPFGSHPEDLKARQEFALKKMYALGYITEEQMREAQGVDVLAKVSTHKENINAPHFVMYVKEYLEKQYGGEAIEQGGLKVYTTLDWDKQQVAEKVVKEGVEKNAKQYQANNAALTAVDPKTGQILAMVGSKDYFGEVLPQGCVPGKNCVFEPNVNVAVRDRQPGSSFKPYVYLTAFKEGFTPDTQLWDVDTNFSTDDGKEYNPKNYDNKNRGLLKMKEALAMSLNVPAVKTLYLVGVKDAVDQAKALGIKTLNYPDRYGLSLVLGGGEVKLLEHTNAFASLAAGGIKREKTAILRIENNKGEVLEQYKQTSGERVIDEKYVAMLDYVLSTNDLRAPVFGNNNPLSFSDRPVAAKTGTTNEWRDGWTMGYTPSLAVGVWVGNNDNSTMAQGADGSYVAAPIWRNFMNEALKNSSVEQFPKYEEEETGKDVLDGKLEIAKEIKVCEIPGKKDEYCLASNACPDKESKKKKFLTAHSILWYVDKNDPQGDAPKEADRDPQFKNWEKAIKKWVEENEDKNYIMDAIPEDKCDSKDFEKYKPSVSISSPSNEKTIITTSFKIQAKASAEYGVKELKIEVDGNKVSSTGSSSISYTYKVPANKKSGELEIKAIIEDDNGNTSSDTVKVKTNIP